MNRRKLAFSTLMLVLVVKDTIFYLWNHSPSDFQAAVLMLAMGAVAFGYMTYSEVVVNA